MLNIAIVEDDPSAAKQLVKYLDKYSAENGVLFSVATFDNALAFLDRYRKKFDLVFMDIEMDDLDGMEAARILRTLDKLVTLIFVTNMAQFAIKGYEVDALDFIVKPVSYYDFAFRLKKAVDRIESGRERDLIVALVGGGC